VRVGHQTKVIGGRKSVAVTVDEFFHHVKECVAFAGVGIRQKEMQHAQHQRAFIVNQRLIRAESFAGVQPVAENDRSHVDEPAFPRTRARDGRILQR